MKSSKFQPKALFVYFLVYMLDSKLDGFMLTVIN